MSFHFRNQANTSFYPVFASKHPDEVDVKYIADEIEYIAKRTSRQQ